jgi:hypothetical protein
MNKKPIIDKHDIVTITFIIVILIFSIIYLNLI